jgi:hypothetical protein
MTTHSSNPADARLVEIAKRHNVSEAAVLALLRALQTSGGSMAQFSHPDLGGMGQWTRGGMTMIGDMFNHDLKARVEALCFDLSEFVRSEQLSDRVEEKSAAEDNASTRWWPSGLGHPSSIGAQNDMRYAFFPSTRRLAVREGNKVTVYDTGDHMISGASQQQASTQTLHFSSQKGAVRLTDLKRIPDD